MLPIRYFAVGLLLLGLSLPAVAQPSETLADHRPLITGLLTLKDAVQRAKTAGFAVLIAEQEARIARAGVGIAQSARLPLLTINSAYTLANNPFFYTLSPGPSNIPRNSAGEFNLGLSLPLYTGGRLEAHLAEATAQGDAADQDVDAARLAAIFAAKQAYFQALLAQRQVVTYREYVRHREASLSQTRDRFAVGKVPRVYILRDETELTAAQQTLIAAQTFYQSALADLKKALGVNPASEFTLSDGFSKTAPTLDLAQALAQTKHHNPELIALQLRIQASTAQVQLATAVYLPQVSLYAQGELRTPESDGFGSGSSLIVAATLPILDFGGRAAEVEKAQANLSKTLLQQGAKEQELAQTVTQAWLNSQQAQSSIQLAQAGITLATEENRLAQERFAVGRSIQVEVLDSFVALLRAQLQEIKARYDYQSALAQLEQAMGGDLP